MIPGVIVVGPTTITILTATVMGEIITTIMERWLFLPLCLSWALLHSDWNLGSDLHLFDEAMWLLRTAAGKLYVILEEIH